MPPELADRIEDIRERAIGANSQLQEYLRDPSYETGSPMELGLNYVGQSGRQYSAFAYPGPPQSWLDLGTSFDEVAALVSETFGVSIQTARAWLSSQTSYFP
jgi:hypothetical protein